MSVEIRRLGPGDLGPYRAMLDLFARAFEDPASYGTPPGGQYIESILADRGIVVLVALSGERVAGALVAYELRKFEQERSEYYIYDLAVEEAERRKGIATALIQALQDLAADSPAWVIYVQADPPDAPAVALYDKLGVREEVYHFDLPVPRKS